MADDNGGLDLWQMLRGMKSPFAPTDPQADSTQYPGVSNQQVYNSRMGALGNVGAVLFAARQPQSMDQRAATLGRLGDAANIQPALNEQQKMLMQNTLLQQQQRLLAQAKQRDAAVQNTEFLAKFGISSDLVKLLGPENIDKLIVARLSRDPIAAAQAQATIDHLKAESGKLDIETQQRKLDLENQGRLGGMLFGGASPETAPSSAAPGMPNVPQPAPQAAADAPASVAGQNPGNVFGGTSAVRPMIRGAQSMLGLNISPVGAAEENATAAIQVLNNKLTGVLSRDLEGRQTTWAQRLARAPLPEPNSFTVGPDRAVERYRAVLGDIKSELEQTTRQARFAFLNKDHGKLQAAMARKADLESVARDVSGVVSGLTANIKGQTPTEHPAAAELRRRGIDPTGFMQQGNGR